MGIYDNKIVNNTIYSELNLGYKYYINIINKLFSKKTILCHYEIFEMPFGHFILFIYYKKSQ